MKEGICPYCGKKTSLGKENKYRPFCSKRCQLADLGRWLKWGEEERCGERK